MLSNIWHKIRGTAVFGHFIFWLCITDSRSVSESLSEGSETANFLVMSLPPPNTYRIIILKMGPTYLHFLQVT